MAVQDRQNQGLANYFAAIDARGTPEPNAPQMPWWSYFMPTVSGLAGLAGAAIGKKRKGPAVGRGIMAGKEAMGMMERALQLDYAAKVRQAEVKRQKAQQMLDNKYRTLGLLISSGDTSTARKILKDDLGLQDAQASVYLKNPILSKVTWLPLQDLAENIGHYRKQLGNWIAENDIPTGSQEVQLAMERLDQAEALSMRGAPEQQTLGTGLAGHIASSFGISLPPAYAEKIGALPADEGMRALGMLAPKLGAENTDKLMANYMQTVLTGGQLDIGQEQMLQSYLRGESGNLLEGVMRSTALRQSLIENGTDVEMPLGDGTTIKMSDYLARQMMSDLQKISELGSYEEKARWSTMTPEQIADDIYEEIFSQVPEQMAEK